MANNLIPGTAPVSLTQGQAAGDMRASVYDPQGKKADVFQYADTKAAEAVATAVSQAPKPQVYTLTLAAASWTADSTSGMYTQAVTISGATASAQVDLAADLVTLENIPSPIVIYNNSGALSAWTAEPPAVDVSVQATVVETEAGV